MGGLHKTALVLCTVVKSQYDTIPKNNEKSDTIILYCGSNYLHMEMRPLVTVYMQNVYMEHTTFPIHYYISVIAVECAYLKGIRRYYIMKNTWV